ncbi:PREDICTED: RNA-directed DNA polymerase from mobile element jockey-like [Trachymyrmex cornetzi]|uniref:RNA-directed DNA polymerase from mobile element jockey-like n=1 Tax=Trachymyrmex cornetzi TaxID=471704 RepID=UPI00084F6F30|nr:PREDICTED: RNA-directed DNA polymerase from mobile element jockey-like [Trachymyrmex cornetzi]
MLKSEVNDNIQDYLRTLSPTQGTDYSLWKATKRLKQPQIPVLPLRLPDGKWARSAQAKAETFAQHLKQVFTPHPGETLTDENEVHRSLNETYQMEPPLEKFKMSEVVKTIKYDISPKKAPGYDLITGQILFEKLILSRLKPIIERKQLIPNHQFGFRHEHATIEQAHRVYNKIFASLEEKKYCSAAFLDITQAFDKVWHTGLLYKIKSNLPLGFYTLLKSYLLDRYFFVQYQDVSTELHKIQAGVPQGSVLGPILYLLYTADLPTKTGVTTATFADDTAVLASHKNPILATQMLQSNLNDIQKWLKTWRIKANEAKSVHVTFTTRRETCPEVSLNGQQIPQSGLNT